MTKKSPSACAIAPPFERLNYFYGQMLGHDDLRREQEYVRGKLQMHNRCLHGHGIACGLWVDVAPPPRDCDPRGDYERALDDVLARLRRALAVGDDAAIAELQAELARLRGRPAEPGATPTEDGPVGMRALLCIAEGLALDRCGNEIVVPHRTTVDVWTSMSDEDRRVVLARAQRGEGTDLHVSICYCPEPTGRTRPIVPDTCGAVPDCAYGRVRDSFRVSVTTEFHADDRCETCCTPTEASECVRLAVLRGFHPEQPLTADHIDDSVRRAVATYTPTVVTGISWSHAARYTRDETKAILCGAPGEGGLEIQFSRPVLTESITDGVVDAWVCEGGRGSAARLYQIMGELQMEQGDTTRWLRYVQPYDEVYQPGDRILITVRTAFLLDECCRPVDGVHVGGRLPILPDYHRFERAEPPAHCAHPPEHRGPWTTGSHIAGGSFESWFYVDNEGGPSRRGWKRDDQ